MTYDCFEKIMDVDATRWVLASKIGFAYSTPLPLNLEGIRGFFFLKYTS